MVNRGTMGVNSLLKTVTRQRRDCDFNPDLSAPESSTLIAKFHYTDTDTGPTRTRTRTRMDPHGPNGVSPQKSPCPCRARVRVRVVEFSYYRLTTLHHDVCGNSPHLVLFVRCGLKNDAALPWVWGSPWYGVDMGMIFHPHRPMGILCGFLINLE